MAKLTERQKNNILAKWHTGQFTKMELAKLYKVDETTIRRITDKQEPKNADIVKVGVALEIAKKAEKTPTETAEINKAIAKIVDETTINDEIASENRKILKEFQNKIKQGLEAGDYENPVDINIGVKTIGEIEKVVRPPKPTVIQNTNAQQNNENNVIEFKRLP